MTDYSACPGYEDLSVTIGLSWIASLFGYFLVWKIDFSFNVTKLKIWQKLSWFVAEKMIILVCGAAFVRAIYLEEDGITDTNGDPNYCYCSNDQL